MAKSKMPPRSQAPLVARPPPPSQAIPPRPSSPNMNDNLSAAAEAEAAAAKKKKKKGKGKKADDDLDDATFHTPALSNAPFSATAKAQADLLATASDLYRRIEADPQGIPDDDAYWTSLPAHLRTFIRNALPIGHLPASAQGDPDDPNSRQASTQAMIAVAQQLAQAAHASQRQLQQHPPSNNANFQAGANNVAYPPFPFDPSVFADLAMQTEQALPLHPHLNTNSNGGYQYNNHINPPPTQPPGEPLPAPVVMVNEFDDEQGDFEDSYYSDEEMDQQEATTIQSRDGWTEMYDDSINGLTTKTSTGTAKKKNKKKKKKGGTDVNATSVPPAPIPTPLAPPVANPPRNNPTNNPLSNQQPPLRSPATTAPPPSSRAAGKQPMTFNASSGKAPANTRTSMNGVGHNHNHGPISNATGKRPASTTASSHGGQGSVNGSAPAAATRAWSSSSAEERERIKDFWLGLNERERKNLIKIEKDGVLKKMKEQQKHNCSCAVCGRKRSSIEDELEVLYDAYYDELEQYANHQQKHVESGGQVPPPPGPGPFPGSVALDSTGAVIGGNGLTKPPAPPAATAPVGNKRPPHQHLHPPPPINRPKAVLPPEDDDAYDEDMEDDEYEDEYEYEDEEDEEEELDEPDVKHSHRRRADVGPLRNGTKAAPNDVLKFGSSLTVKGGILTVADDLLKNDGQKFLEMMEQLAERRSLREEEVQAELDNASEEEDIENEEGEDDEVVTPEDALTDEQRMEEGRRMFQIFAARMFEQRVLQAYRERVAQERQLQLLRELEEEDMAEKEKEAKKAKENQKKKDKKRQAKQQKEEERMKLEEAKAAEEAAARAKVERQREVELKKQEDLRLKREAEKRQKDEEKAKKEEERRKKQEEERTREMEKERKKKEREDRIRLEKEAKEREIREAKEAKERKEEEERIAKEQVIKKEALLQQQKEREAAISTPTSPVAIKTQLAPNAQVKSTATSASIGPSSSLPSGRRSEAPSSPSQGRGASKGASIARPMGLGSLPQTTATPSSLPAPPQGLPARPSTVSHSQQASLSIPSGVAAAASLPRPPIQSIPPTSSVASIGSPARQATPTNGSSSSATPSKMISPPLAFAPSAVNNVQGSSATFPKASSGMPSQAAPTQQPIGRYSSVPFGNNALGTPTRSPPSNGTYMKSGPFDSILGSPSSVNAATAGIASLNVGGMPSSSNASQPQMPIGPIGGALPSSSTSLNSPHARTTSISGISSMDDYATRQGVTGSSRSIQRPAPGPIGPIGRRRDPSQDEFGGGSTLGGIGSTTQSVNNSIFGGGGSSSMTPLAEKVLGSSALGGDDELVEPQPRRTSHNTAPISNSSTLFGSGAFGVTSPWASTFASNNAPGSIGGPIGSSSSNSGIPRTPSTPNATSRLHSALGSGLTSPSSSIPGGSNGSSAGSNAFGSLHQTSVGASGMQANLNTGVDPWMRAANGWDRARFAFEQPKSQQQSTSSSGLPNSSYPTSQQQMMSGGSASSPFGVASSLQQQQQQHPALRNVFGAPGTASSISNTPRHSNERGL